MGKARPRAGEKGLRKWHTLLPPYTDAFPAPSKPRVGAGEGTPRHEGSRPGHLGLLRWTITEVKDDQASQWNLRERVLALDGAAGDHFGSSRFLVWLLLGGLLFHSGIAVYFYLHLEPAIARLMPDDAFYYLKIAENVSKGLGSVFSEGVPTNGYHPLWMILLAGVHHVLAPDQDLFVLYTLLTAAAFYALSGWLLARLLRAFGFHTNQVLFGTALYLFLPPVVNMSLTGLETPLFHSLLFLFFLLLDRLNREQERRLGSYAAFGLVSGLLMLARTDSVFLTAFGYGYLFCKRPRTALKGCALSFTIAVATTLPWLLWSRHTFGTIVQSSGFAMVWYTHSLLPDVTDLSYLPRTSKIAIDGLYKLLGSFWTEHLEPSRGTRLERWLCLGFVAGSFAAAAARVFLTNIPRIPLFVWAPSVLLLLFNLYVKVWLQVWHLSVLLILLIFCMLTFLPVGWLSRRVTVVTAILLTGMTTYTLQHCYFRPQQRNEHVIRSCKQYEADAPRRLKIGSTDCGLLGYFSRHEVVNLDGVVNNEVLEYIKAGRFDDYLAKEDLDIIEIDTKGFRLEYYNRNMGAPPSDGE